MEMEKELRERHKWYRSNMKTEDVKLKSSEICKKLQEQKQIWQAEHFYFYYPCRNEVELLELAKYILQTGKKAAFPKVNGTTMEFYQIETISDFAEGRFHIMEPIAKTPVQWKDAVVFVPGLAFDAKGNRIGYGKGYYDRYFHTHQVGYKIGIAYEHQIEEIKAKDWDVPMDAVITECQYRKMEEKRWN